MSKTPIYAIAVFDGIKIKGSSVAEEILVKWSGEIFCRNNNSSAQKSNNKLSVWNLNMIYL